MTVHNIKLNHLIEAIANHLNEFKQISELDKEN